MHNITKTGLNLEKTQIIIVKIIFTEKMLAHLYQKDINFLTFE